MKKNREKYDSFAEYILNDDKFVMKFLIIMAQGVAFAVFLFLFILGLLYTNWIMIGFFGIFLALIIFKMYKFYFVWGGIKMTEGLSASDTVWNKPGLKIGKKKNDAK